MSAGIIDTSALIFLARLRRLDLSRTLGRVVVPQPVLEELLRGQSKDPETVSRVVGWMAEVQIVPSEVILPADFHPTLGAGERAVLRLALEVREPVAVIDDRAARRAARQVGVRTVSTPYLLVRGVRENRLRADRAESDLDRLVALGYYLDPKLYAEIRETIRSLRLVGKDSA